MFPVQIVVDHFCNVFQQITANIDNRPMAEGMVIVNMIGLTKPGFKGQIVIDEPDSPGMFRGTLMIQGFEPGKYLAQIIVKSMDGAMSKQVVEIEIAEAEEAMPPVETVTVTETETVMPQETMPKAEEMVRTVVKEVTVVRTVTGVETETVTITETVTVGPSTAQIAAVAVIVIVIVGLLLFLTRKRS
jgi:hypothetical protein